MSHLPYSYICAEAFNQYCTGTAEVLIDSYPWYNMPASVRKFLLHGPRIVENFLLPIHMYSEETQEALNKYVRNVRSDHTRKVSTKKTMEDQFHYILILDLFN